MTQTFRSRVLAGSGANAIGQVLSIGIQLASLPLFLHYWDATNYGVWLILAAIPSYLAMADVGIVTAAGNRMMIAMGMQEPAEANKIFQSALLFVLLVCGALIAILIPAILFFPIPNITANSYYRIAILFLSGCVFLTLFGGLTDAIFKSTERYPTGTMLSNLVRLLEWCGSILGLIFFGTFSAVAAGGFIARAIALVFVSAVATKGNHGFRWGVSNANLLEIRGIAKPAFSFMLFPLSFALSIQGFTLLIAHALGPAAVAIFNTYRTFARISVQATSVLSHALWPEFSRLYGANKFASLLQIYKSTFWLGLILAIVLSAVQYITAPFALRIWTHDRITYEPFLMILMLIYAATSSAGHIPRILLSAVNRHSWLAVGTTLASLVSLVIASLLVKIADINGMAIALLLAECATTLISCLLCVRFLKSISQTVMQLDTPSINKY